MDFRTILLRKKSNIDINYHTNILAIGSCFAENIGSKLQNHRFSTTINPFGILFNPVSIAQGLLLLMSEDFEFGEKDIFQQDDLWHSWMHHGRFSHPQKSEILRGINKSFSTAQHFFKTTNQLIITLGTANVYVEKNTQSVVANCHKVPPQYFDKKCLSVNEIIENWTRVLNQINTQYVDKQIIMTVSPIRHIRDGIIENQHSKAVLLVAIHEICQQFPNVHYFPAYEIMMDDLRDYRFYEADMIHPTTQAIDYIWQFFMDTFFTNDTKNIVEEVKKMNALLQHRPLHPNTEGYQKFVQNVAMKLEILKAKYPYLNFDNMSL